MSEWFTKRTLGQVTATAAEKWGSQEALVFEQKRWNWREFEEEVCQAARGLIAAGVSPGEKVAAIGSSNVSVSELSA